MSLRIEFKGFELKFESASERDEFIALSNDERIEFAKENGIEKRVYVGSRNNDFDGDYKNLPLWSRFLK